MHPDATTITIYTDGSGIESKIGAAMYNSSTNEVNHQYLGSETQFNVYTAELTVLNLAIKQLWNHSECLTGRIYTNSQASVKAIDHPRRQSGQTIIKDILDNIDELVNEHKHLHIEVVWISGHAEIEGNEHVDAEAKKAAQDPTLSQLRNCKPLKSARARYIKTAAKKQWHIVWNENTKTATSLRRIIKGKYVKTGSALYNEIADPKSADNYEQALRTKSLPPSFRHQEHIILPMRIWKRDSGALSLRMPKIQRTEEEAQKGDWSRENAGVKTTRRYEGDKAQVRIYQCNR